MANTPNSQDIVLEITYLKAKKLWPILEKVQNNIAGLIALSADERDVLLSLKEKVQEAVF